MTTKNMVIGKPKMLPLGGVCKGCVLGNHHQIPLNLGKAL